MIAIPRTAAINTFRDPFLRIIDKEERARAGVDPIAKRSCAATAPASNDKKQLVLLLLQRRGGHCSSSGARSLIDQCDQLSSAAGVPHSCCSKAIITNPSTNDKTTISPSRLGKPMPAAAAAAAAAAQQQLKATKTRLNSVNRWVGSTLQASPLGWFRTPAAISAHRPTSHTPTLTSRCWGVRHASRPTHNSTRPDLHEDRHQWECLSIQRSFGRVMACLVWFGLVRFGSVRFGLVWFHLFHSVRARRKIQLPLAISHALLPGLLAVAHFDIQLRAHHITPGRQR